MQLDERDCDVTCFLWLRDSADPDSNLVTYRFKSVLFGATCSPFILQATLMKHFGYRNNNRVSEILKKDLYVDNVISSFSDKDTLINFFHDTGNLMSSADFNLRPWMSNSYLLLMLAAADNILGLEEITKILGMGWNADSDQIFLTNRPDDRLYPVTKRAILQETAKLYDPLGFFSPITTRSKILLQDLWKQKYEWDVPMAEYSRRHKRFNYEQISEILL